MFKEIQKAYARLIPPSWYCAIKIQHPAYLFYLAISYKQTYTSRPINSFLII